VALYKPTPHTNDGVMPPRHRITKQVMRESIVITVPALRDLLDMTRDILFVIIE
jgi:hypothetical protein